MIIPPMKYYTIVLLNHDDEEIERRPDVEGKAKAIDCAKYWLTNDHAHVLETTHETLDTKCVRVLDEKGECVWEKTHPGAHEITRLKILRDVTQGIILDLEDLGTTGKVNYVLGGRTTLSLQHVDHRWDEIACLFGDEQLQCFANAVRAEYARRDGTLDSLPKKIRTKKMIL